MVLVHFQAQVTVIFMQKVADVVVEADFSNNKEEDAVVGVLCCVVVVALANAKEDTEPLRKTSTI